MGVPEDCGELTGSLRSGSCCCCCCCGCCCSSLFLFSSGSSFLGFCSGLISLFLVEDLLDLSVGFLSSAFSSSAALSVLTLDAGAWFEAMAGFLLGLPRRAGGAGGVGSGTAAAATERGAIVSPFSAAPLLMEDFFAGGELSSPTSFFAGFLFFSVAMGSGAFLTWAGGCDPGVATVVTAIFLGLPRFLRESDLSGLGVAIGAFLFCSSLSGAAPFFRSAPSPVDEVDARRVLSPPSRRTTSLSPTVMAPLLFSSTFFSFSRAVMAGGSGFGFASSPRGLVVS